MFSEAAVLSESRGSRHDCRFHAYSRLRRTEGGGICTRRQTPPPHFCLKVVRKKGGVFSGAYGMSSDRDTESTTVTLSVPDRGQSQVIHSLRRAKFIVPHWRERREWVK